MNKKIISIFVITTLLITGGISSATNLTKEEKQDEVDNLTVCNGKEFNIGKMSVHPGTIWDKWSPDLDIDFFNFDDTIYIDRHDKVTFTANWEIKEDTLIGGSESWYFGISTIPPWSDNEAFRISTNSIWIKEEIGPDDSDSGKISCNVKYKKQDRQGHQQWIHKGAEARLYIRLRIFYHRGEDEWYERGKSKTISIIFTGNQAPNTPQITKAPSEVKVGEDNWFYAQGTDPENDCIMYGWDWNGDLFVDRWAPGLPVESGKESGAPKQFNDEGTYQIRVKARDYLWRDESDWSKPVELTVSKSRTKDKTLFIQQIDVLLERWGFPLLIKFLNL